MKDTGVACALVGFGLGLGRENDVEREREGGRAGRMRDRMGKGEEEGRQGKEQIGRKGGKRKSTNEFINNRETRIFSKVRSGLDSDDHHLCNRLLITHLQRTSKQRLGRTLLKSLEPYFPSIPEFRSNRLSCTGTDCPGLWHRSTCRHSRSYPHRTHCWRYVLFGGMLNEDGCWTGR